VIGPGLGRCPLVCEATARIIQHAKKQKLALVLDADALWMLAQPPYRSLFENYNDAPVVLTPNVVEYKRLLAMSDDNENSNLLFQHATIVKKGQHDAVMKNGKELLSCLEEGGKKRSGGIGDVLAGTLGTLVAWNVILSSKRQKEQNSNNNNDEEDQRLALACWTACCFVKQATKQAFTEKKRSMTAPDVLECLGPAIDRMTCEFDTDTPSSNL